MTNNRYRHHGEDSAHPENDNARGQAGEVGKAKQGQAHCTKKDAIRAAISHPQGLNRFEAERHGDHCLNSTIAELRKDGCDIYSRPEIVPTRFNARGVRVFRYWLIKGAA